MSSSFSLFDLSVQCLLHYRPPEGVALPSVTDPEVFASRGLRDRRKTGWLPWALSQVHAGSF
uniref:Uncharacterized protein n=1 Tax=Faecalibaculum rodentium TaxID=1702221 RepID=A0A140DS38_9FIRM|nr:hypothetical protein AALO17_03310 [Faecalibaculum rodentium]